MGAGGGRGGILQGGGAQVGRENLMGRLRGGLMEFRMKSVDLGAGGGRLVGVRERDAGQEQGQSGDGAKAGVVVVAGWR